MENEKSDKKQTNHKKFTVLVPVDFSPCSVQALQSARSIMGQRPDRILVLHVIDHDFVERCIRHSFGTEEDIKKTLFLEAKSKLENLLHMEGMDGAEKLICEGIPFLEINNQTVQCGADMIVMGTQGNSGEMKNIFFGSTTEWVLRFIKRPVLCIPLDEDHNLR